MEIETLELLQTDFDDVRQTISACLVYFTAQDVAASQQRMGQLRQSHITQELERVKERLDGVLGDWLLARHLAEEDTVVLVRDFDEEDLDLDLEEDELPAEPLGSFTKYRRTAYPVDRDEEPEGDGEGEDGLESTDLDPDPDDGE